MRDNVTMMWVAPEFKRKIKQESSLNDMSIIEYTKHLAVNGEVESKEILRSKRRFNIGF